MARLFVAAWPPPDVVEAIGVLPQPPVDGVRWMPSETWHVTLRFLGDAEIDEAVRVLTRVRAEPAEAVLGPRPVSLFRGVLALPVVGLDDLARAVIATTATVGQPPDDRAFRGHLTLARWRRRPPPSWDGTVAASWTVDEVALVRSTSSLDGARYETIHAIRLAG